MLFHSDKTPIELKLIHLNQKQQKRREQLLAAKNDKNGLKQLKKSLAKQAKKALKDNLKGKNKGKKSVYVIDFDGDIKASAVKHLREEISTILSCAEQGDEVVVRLESPGGLVNGYGLAAAQLVRIKDANLHLTICVDKVAASGGYMMACVADKIYAAPFAVIGSIGVVAQLPNFNKVLKNHDIEYEMFTAGDYKRTVTIFGENDDKGRAKFQQEIEQTHQLFKHFVTTYRPKLDLDAVATGEHWYGEDALNLGLVDELKTSDAYLLEKMQTQEVYVLHSQTKPTLAQKLGFAAMAEQSASCLIDMVSDKLPQVITQLNNGKRSWF